MGSSGLLWALVGSGVVSLRIYSILGGLRLGSSWAPVGLRVLLPLGLLLGSRPFCLRIYSILGGLRLGSSWAPAPGPFA